MDRRRFLTTTSITGASFLALQGTRLYGSPTSNTKPSSAEAGADALLPHLFRLHATLDNASSAYTPMRLAACRMALDIVRDEDAANSFLADPGKYMEKVGIPNGTFDTETREYRLAQALADTKVRAAAAAGDTKAFLSAMARISKPDLGLTPDQLCHCSDSYTYLNVVSVVTIGVVALVTVAIAVAVVVAGESGNVQSDVASVLGGTDFAQDVTQTKARTEIQRLIAAIEDGQITLPYSGITEKQALTALNNALGKHLID
jgi:hypothetical protein